MTLPIPTSYTQKMIQEARQYVADQDRKQKNLKQHPQKPTHPTPTSDNIEKLKFSLAETAPGRANVTKTFKKYSQSSRATTSTKQLTQANVQQG